MNTKRKLCCTPMGPNPRPQKITRFCSSSVKVFPNTLTKLVFAAKVNFIMQQRNHRIFNGIQRSPSFVIDQIKIGVHVKASQCGSVKISDISYLWFIPSCIFWPQKLFFVVKLFFCFGGFAVIREFTSWPCSFLIKVLVTKEKYHKIQHCE